MALGMGIKDLDVYGETQLVINQLLEEFEVKWMTLFHTLKMHCSYWIN